ncbi:MAG: Eco57I restriction-modification methylase domain-containing protein [Lentisphaeria bacterium]|nr:Eco57I restriction-modification methylase domain-containing protein [Lentisphaeria bacterium]
MIDTSCLDAIIVGRVEPHIYAFTTNTIPNYLKVGDTYRPVALRLQEWQTYFPELQKQFEGSAKINDEIYFRDFAVHHYLENAKGRIRLQPGNIPADLYYSREFFKEATAEDVKEAIDDIKLDYANSGSRKYQFYNAQDSLPVLDEYPRTETYSPRPNQEATIARFNEARANGRTNLLMYAVMRFGKSFTSMCCAVEMSANLVVVVSAKADVVEEWKKTVQSHVKFAEYVFVISDDLKSGKYKISNLLADGKRCVVFLTLQDLQGDDIKEKHKELFGFPIDLLLVDETHFGARGEKYGQVLRGSVHKLDSEDYMEAEEADKIVKSLETQITIHLSGTPYRILMGSEFQKEDIIAFYQFTDIVDDQKKWDVENRLKPEAEAKEDWSNPYYGFPEMIRFAFNLNESSRKRLAQLREDGTTTALSALLKPQCIRVAPDGSHKKFVYEQEVLDLLQVIDGSKDDDALLGFLNYDKIKAGKMCRHIVIVLPYCASCDALETLIKTHANEFNNLKEYEIINISGVDQPQKYKTPESIKSAIKSCEDRGQKTITLTVNRMLTGSTVPEWDTMLYLKDTASPQEYDQAIFRLQNQYIKVFKDENGNEIKFNMKPQTLLVDFMPDRMFRMQELKSQIYNVNTDEFGNSHLKDRLIKELSISPIIVLNKDKLVQVNAGDILQAVSEYSQSRGVADEVIDIPVDLSLLEIEDVRRVIENENALGSKEGLSTKAHQGDGEGDDVDIPDNPSSSSAEEGTGDDNSADKSATDNDDTETRIKQFRTFYSRILFFAFLTKTRVASLSDVIACIDETNNTRIVDNLGIDRQALVAIQNMNWAALRTLDYKIQNINTLSRDHNADPLKRCEVAIKKFGKLSEAEIVTPAHICSEMVNLIPDNEWQRIIDKGDKILDIASKVGEFTVAICSKLKSLGYQSDRFNTSILAIPTSTVAYEFTRRIYEELGLNLSCLASNFTTYDLLDIKNDSGNIDYQRICSILKQNKPFNSIALDDTVNEGEEEVNIEAVIGNPPYQDQDGSGGSNDASLYQYFVECAHEFNPAFVSMIMPSRWFSGGRENLLANFRRTMLNRSGMKELYAYANPREVFPDVEIKGGVCHYLFDESYQGLCNYTLIKDHVRQTTPRVLNELEVLVRDPFLSKIVKKIIDDGNVSDTVSSIISGDTPFGVPTKPTGSKKKTFELFENKRGKDRIALYYIEKIVRKKAYIKRSSITKNANAIDAFKVFIPEASGSGSDPFVLGTPEYAAPPSVCSQSYLYVEFAEEEAAKNFIAYLKTKFFRILVSACKISQHTSNKVYRFVPIQDFTSASDIDWSVPIPEIDKQLYAKYKLSADEINFIETAIKPME